MSFITSIICFLIFQNLAFAEQVTMNNTWLYAYTTAVIIISVFATILFTSLAFLTIRYMKKNHSPPEYFDDEIVIEKKEFQNLDETPEIYQIQPIITVSEVVSSVKESLEHLGNTVMPKRWSPEVSN